jgi:hypothetical protein
MATCDMGFDHEESAVAVDDPAPVLIDPGPNENDVKIAEINAEADIKRGEQYTEQAALELAAENERLRGENAGMKEILDRVVPPAPDPADADPVIVPVPDPIPDPVEPAAPVPESVPSGKKSGKAGYWDNYS